MIKFRIFIWPSLLYVTSFKVIYKTLLRSWFKLLGIIISSDTKPLCFQIWRLIVYNQKHKMSTWPVSICLIENKILVAFSVHITWRYADVLQNLISQIKNYTNYILFLKHLKSLVCKLYSFVKCSPSSMLKKILMVSYY